MKVRKTRAKLIHFPAATVHVREVQRVCPGCKRVWACPEYAALAPHGGNTSWGLLAWVGQQRFHEDRRLEKMRVELAGRGVRVSLSTLVRASDEYLNRFVALHDDPALWEGLLKRPPPWLTDSTTENGGGSVLVVRADGYTVHADGVPSEAAPYVASILAEAKRRTGTPLVVGRDFSEGLQKGLCDTVPTVVQAGCHTHWGRDAGKDAMGEAHVALQKALQGSHARSRLQALAREGTGVHAGHVASLVGGVFESRGGAPFPYRVPGLDVVHAIDDAHAWASQALAAAARENRCVPLVAAFKAELERYRLDPEAPTELARTIRRHAHVLERVQPWFDRIRDALRRFREGPQDAQAASLVLPVVTRIEIEARAVGGYDGLLGLELVAAARRRWDELLTPVVVDGKAVRVDRTTTELEQAHGWWKRGVRHRTGRKSVAQALRHHGTGLAHVQNWERPEFQETLGGHAGLIRRLAAIDGARLAMARAVVRRLRPPAGRRRAKREAAAIRAALAVPSTPSIITSSSVGPVEVANR